MNTICNHNALNMSILQYFVVYSSQYWRLQNTPLIGMNNQQTFRGHAFSATLNYMLAMISIPPVSGCNLQLKRGRHGYKACSNIKTKCWSWYSLDSLEERVQLLKMSPT